DDGTSIDLQLAQNGKVLSIAAAQSGALKAYLATKTVSNDAGVTVDASMVWPEFGKIGRAGSLVAVIVKGGNPGELYDLSGGSDYPIPVVAVVATGAHWPMLIARALGQTIGGLGDEWEASGVAFDKGPEGVLVG